MRWLPLALLLAARVHAFDSAAEAREYQVKAVFLYNFAQFVDWPPASFKAPDSPIVIGILGDDPFGPYLDETVKGEKINNRALVVRRFRHVEDIAGCHILFISLTSSADIEAALSGLKGRSILTVGDADNFGRMGGMIRFVTEKNKIRLKINLGAAQSAGLKISSKLLRPAEIVSMRRADR